MQSKINVLDWNISSWKEKNGLRKKLIPQKKLNKMSVQHIYTQESAHTYHHLFDFVWKYEPCDLKHVYGYKIMLLKDE